MYDKILNFLGRDKVQHFCFGALFAILAGALLNAFQVPVSLVALGSVATAAVVGIAKEWADHLDNADRIAQGEAAAHTVDVWDAVATALGGAYVAFAFSIAHWVARLP